MSGIKIDFPKSKLLSLNFMNKKVIEKELKVTN